MLDFNDAETSSFDLIPANTIAPVITKLRPGAAGPGGWLKASKSSDNLMLDFEITVTGGAYAKRKFFANMVIDGSSEKAIAITRGHLRAMLESARNIRPDDMSEAAVAGRKIADFRELNGLEFIAKIGIEKGTGEYADKNKLICAITPENKAFGEALKGGAAPVAQPGFTPGIATFTPGRSAEQLVNHLASGGKSSSPTTTSLSSNGAAPAWASR